VGLLGDRAADAGIDFVEQAQRSLQAGQVALLAEIEEEWIVPVDVALEAAGGRPKYVEMPGVGHDTWTPTYHDPAALDWLFVQRRRPK
jgi:predicted peptidase